MASSIPSTLIALILVSAVAIYFNLPLHTIKEIPQGFPVLHFEIFTAFNFEMISPLLIAIFSLAMLGSIDSLLTSVIVDNMEKTQHNSSQELVSQGIGNGMAAIFGGIPGSSATIRTLLNMNSGGKTRISGIISSVLLLVIVMFLAPVASKIPYAVLAGVLITVGFGILDYRGLKAIGKMPIGDVMVMFVVMFLTIFWDLVIAVGVGLIISALIFMKKMGDVNTNRMKSSSNTGGFLNSELPWSDEKNIPHEIHGKIFVKHLEGPLFFGYTNELQQMFTQIPDTAKTIIIRMDKVPYIDQSGLYTMEDIFIDFEKNGKNILLVGLQKQPEYLMRKIDIIPNLISEEHRFANFKECVEWLQKNSDEEGRIDTD